MEAVILFEIGTLHQTLQNREEALNYLNQALSLQRSLGDSKGQIQTLLYLGLTYGSFGEREKQIETFNKALSLARAEGDREEEAAALMSIGLSYRFLGELQKALDSYNQALSLRRGMSSKLDEALTLEQIGVIYTDLGEYQKALDIFNQVLPVIRATDNPLLEASILGNIGLAYSYLGEEEKALDFYNQELIIDRATSASGGASSTLYNIGSIYLNLGQITKAEETLSEALRLTEGFSPATKAPILIALGNIYSLSGETQKALEFFNQALSLNRFERRTNWEAQTLYSIADLERNRGNLEGARSQLEAAINIIENLRTKIGSQQLRTSYFAKVQNYYQLYIDLLMQLNQQNPSKGYDALALQASERARARTLLELLKEANADIRRGVDPQLFEKSRTLQQQLNAREYRRYQLLNGEQGYSQKELDTLKQDIENILTQLEQVEAQIRVKNPGYAAINQPAKFTLTLPQIQQQVLDDNSVLLEYSLGEERSYLWAVTKTSISSYELPKRADIEAAAKEFYTQLKSETGSLAAGMKLSQMILAPVANQLGNKRLLIVSDGALQLIPFAALPIPEKTSPPTPLPPGQGSNTLAPPSLAGKGAGGLGLTPLLVEHEVVSLPSASAVAVLRNELKGRKPADKTVAVIADPVFTCCDDPRFQTGQEQQSNVGILPSDAKRSATDIGVTLERLEYSRKEAEEILALVPETQRQSAFDFSASLTTLPSLNLAQYRIIHFATHGLLNSVQPELSGVVLSLFNEKGADQDGFLRLRDIFNLNLPAELVVLSACETGLGKEVKGEGLVGLTRGFMYAGAKRVVVSLWSVNDTATSQLMSKFYTQMLEKGLNPVAALRAAQLEMWKTEDWKAPYYWAAFTVQGEWNE